MALMVEPEFQRAAEGNGQEGKGTCARKHGLLIRDATDQSQAQNKQEESSLSSLAAINLSTVATSPPPVA